MAATMSTLMSPFAASLARIAHEAGRLILTHYAQGAKARVKADFSPVTAADEEVAAGRLPRTGNRFFLVDPLDGTKEFVKRNGEFTVNIALIENRRPVCGVVLAPAKARAFIGDGVNGAFELAAPEDLALDVTQAEPIRARKPPVDGLVVIASRTHRDTKTEEYLAAYRVSSLLAAGSSLKFCLVATGEADLYPRHGRTMEWDTAAGQAVLEAAGGSVRTLEGAPLSYGKTDAGFANPYFVARGMD